MAHSLEVRPPLLDHRVIEFALSLDPSLLADPTTGKGKLMIRRVMEDRVPAGHLDLPKRGFTLPMRDCIRRRPELISDALDRLTDAGVIQRPSFPRFDNTQIWTLLFLDRWMVDTGVTI